MSNHRLVINFEELTNDLIPMLQDLNQNLKRDPFELNPKIKKKLNAINNTIPQAQSLEDFCNCSKYLLNLFSQIHELKGNFCIEGHYKNIPAIQGDYEVIYKYDYDVHICALEFSQSGWKKEDRWSLNIDNKIIFDHVTTKEIGDKKYFHTLKYVKANTKIKFILHNVSGNSRQVWTDLEYIQSLFPEYFVTIKCIDVYGNTLKQEKVKVSNIPSIIKAPVINDYFLVSDNEEQLVTKDTAQPIIFQYDHSFNIKIVTQWEKNSPTDVDAYATLLNSNRTVWFGNRREEGLWLDTDVRQHMYSQQPEIITCLNKTDLLKYSLRNYNSEQLNEPVIISIYKCNENDDEHLIKTIEYILPNNRQKCDIFQINLNNYEIKIL